MIRASSDGAGRQGSALQGRKWDFSRSLRIGASIFLVDYETTNRIEILRCAAPGLPAIRNLVLVDRHDSAESPREASAASRGNQSFVGGTTDAKIRRIYHTSLVGSGYVDC